MGVSVHCGLLSVATISQVLAYLCGCVGPLWSIVCCNNTPGSGLLVWVSRSTVVYCLLQQYLRFWPTCVGESVHCGLLSVSAIPQVLAYLYG